MTFKVCAWFWGDMSTKIPRFKTQVQWHLLSDHIHLVQTISATYSSDLRLIQNPLLSLIIRLMLAFKSFICCWLMIIYVAYFWQCYCEIYASIINFMVLIPHELLGNMWVCTKFPRSESFTVVKIITLDSLEFEKYFKWLNEDLLSLTGLTIWQLVLGQVKALTLLNNAFYLVSSASCRCNVTCT